jgi:TolA-binding protein
LFVKVEKGRARVDAADRAYPLGPDEEVRISPADELGVENALYEKGLRFKRDGGDNARAIAAWREYLDRYPTGALAPEASQGILTALIDDRRFSEAVEEADRYLDRFAQKGARAEEVMLVRANLLLDHLNAPERSLEAYRAIASSAERSDIRDEATFAIARSLRALGKKAESRAALDAYLSRFPNGAHRTDAEKLSR